MQGPQTTGRTTPHEVAQDEPVIELPVPAQPEPAEVLDISFDFSPEPIAELPLEPEAPPAVRLPVSDYVASFGTTQVIRVDRDEPEEPLPGELDAGFDFDLSPAAVGQPEAEPPPA